MNKGIALILGCFGKFMSTPREISENTPICGLTYCSLGFWRLLVTMGFVWRWVLMDAIDSGVDSSMLAGCVKS